MDSNNTHTGSGEKKDLFFRLLPKFSAILSAFMLVVPIIIAVKQAQIMQASDFVMTFYIIGKMISAGHAQGIYPDAHSTSFIGAPFDLYAHSVLPALPVDHTAIFMYCPAVAWIFSAFSNLEPIQALIIWQGICILALLLCVYIHSRDSKTNFFQLLGLGALFTPVFHQLLIGHLSIPLGMMPLSVGYFLLCSNHFLAGGMVWALLFLKIQYLPTVLLVLGALFLSGKFRAPLGFLLGTLMVALVNIFCLGSDVARNWLSCLRLSDAIFSDPRYGYPHYLAVSIPSMVLQTVPSEMRDAAKLPAYLLAALIGLGTLWYASKLFAKHDIKSQLANVMLLGIFVLPLVLPHFLFYDLCCFSIAALIIYGNNWDEKTSKRLKRIRIYTFVCINLYFINFFFLGLGIGYFPTFTILVCILTFAYIQIVRTIR
ncbi:MAG: DUF2029 domain-containing protein, partial [Candidatus Obscuribacterales bacterium]|nr:DUF2029 domain-containing protein [Candidatus Obscuribacterales bacterium]